MNAFAQLIETLSIPGFIATILVTFFLLLQVIGELCELKGKIVPEFLKIRKYFQRKKRERQEKKQTLQATKEALERVRNLLESVDSHYSKDNISKRDKWMAWVNKKAEIYDEALLRISELSSKLEASNEMTLDLYINVNRNRILDFASKVANHEALASREEFNRIYKVNRDYHEIIEKHGKQNGEVDIAMQIIDDAYRYRAEHHCFIEDIRGYR